MEMVIKKDVKNFVESIIEAEEILWEATVYALPELSSYLSLMVEEPEINNTHLRWNLETMDRI